MFVSVALATVLARDFEVLAGDFATDLLAAAFFWTFPLVTLFKGATFLAGDFVAAFLAGDLATALVTFLAGDCDAFLAEDLAGVAFLAGDLATAFVTFFAGDLTWAAFFVILAILDKMRLLSPDITMDLRPFPGIWTMKLTF